MASFSDQIDNQPQQVLAEATQSATESADTAITGPTLFLIFTSVALIAFALLRFTPLYRRDVT